MNTKLIAGLVVIAALGIGGWVIFGQNNAQPVGNNNPVLPMAGTPCHQMGGQWMGDCEFDSDGNVIPLQY